MSVKIQRHLMIQYLVNQIEQLWTVNKIDCFMTSSATHKVLEETGTKKLFSPNYTVLNLLMPNDS